jgi:hypothetical protein
MNAIQPGQNNDTLITPVIIAFVVNYVIKKYNPEWWKKYAYVMSAAFDAGSAIGLLIIFFAFLSNASNQVVMKPWWGNQADSDGCAPDYYLICKMNQIQGSAFGNEYNITNDPYCLSIGFQTDKQRLS